MSNFLIILISCASVVLCAFGASIPGAVDFLQYAKNHIQSECSFPPRAALEIKDEKFPYKACQFEMANKTVMGNVCGRIINLTDMVCYKMDDKMKSKFKLMDIIGDIDDVQKPFEEVDNAKQKVDDMCKQPFAVGPFQGNVFKSLQECKDKCLEEKYYSICRLYFAMEKLERSTFKDVRTFEDLAIYIGYAHDRHAFPPVSSILDSSAPLYGCRAQTELSAPVCQAILNVSAIISDRALPEMDSFKFLADILKGPGCGNFNGLPTLPNVTVQPCLTCTSEKEKICRSLLYGIQYVVNKTGEPTTTGSPSKTEPLINTQDTTKLGLKVGDKCDSASEVKCVENAECVGSVCTCMTGFFPSTDQQLLCVKATPPSNSATSSAVALGKNCMPNIESMCGTNAECSNNICLCKPGFSHSPDNSNCIPEPPDAIPATTAALKVGEKCDVDGTSKCGENAICTESICTCPTGYSTSADQSSCVKATPAETLPATALKVGEKCDVDSASKCGENAVCTESVCTCPTGYSTSADQSSCVKATPAGILLATALKVGEKCESAAQCVTNADCIPNSSNENVCQCKSGSTASADNMQCSTTPTITALKVGEKCESAAQCVTNADCIPNSSNENVCQCKSGNTASADNTQCSTIPTITALKVGEKCESAAQCVNNADCIPNSSNENVCQCKSGNTASADNMQCSTTPTITALKVGEKCESAAQCVTNADCIPNSSNENVCQCKSGNTASADNMQCSTTPTITALKVGEKCESAAQCVTNADCIPNSSNENVCQCKSGNTASADNTQCSTIPTITALKVGEKCESAAQCVTNADCIPNSSNENVCQCKSGNTASTDNMQCSTTPTITASKVGEKCEDAAQCGAYAECTPNSNNEKICLCKLGYAVSADETSCGEIKSYKTTDNPFYYDDDDDDYFDDDSDELGMDQDGDNDEEITDDGLDLDGTEGGNPKEEPGLREPPAKEAPKEKPVNTVNQHNRPMPSMDDDEKGGIGFMSYLLVFTVLIVAGYLVFHNKKKIIAMVVEGKTEGRGGRRPNSGQYRKLKTEEVMPDLEKSASSTNYVY